MLANVSVGGHATHISVPPERTTVGMLAAWDRRRGNSGPPATPKSGIGPGSGSSEIKARDEGVKREASVEWKSRASALAGATLPLVPARVAAAFAEGLMVHHPYDSRSSVNNVPSSTAHVPAPRIASAAMLLLDVSGFTALSEDARRRLGSVGVECFSLALSAFFETMISIIASHHGDIDCFAGDAVLVVFEPREDDGSDDAGGAPAIPGTMDDGDGVPGSVVAMRGAVRQALSCALAVHQQLDGFRNEPQDPPLGLHSAIAAGKKTAACMIYAL